MSATVSNPAHLSPTAADGRIEVAPGVEIAFIDRGKGQPVVLIPGWTFTKEMFEKQIDALSQHYRVISYDPRAQGSSSFVMEGNDYETHGHDLTVLLKLLKVQNPVLVGWSAGAHAAWSFIRRNGVNSVAANIVIDMPPKCLCTDPDLWVHGTLDEVAAIHTIFLRDAKGQAEFIKRHAETALVQRNLYPDELDWIVGQSLATKPLIAAQLFASFMFSDHTAQAISIARAKPTLFFISQGWSGKAIPYMQRMLPETKYVVFGGGMMFWEYPDAFNQVLLDFIRQNVSQNIGG
jgi:pimeloyl-ACP methyl ester carboxylesterase